MPFPDLTLRTDPSQRGGLATLWADALGVPDNGDNTFAIPFLDVLGSSAQLVEEMLIVVVRPLSSSSTVTFATFTPGSFLAVDKRSITINFEQSGSDQCEVIVGLLHTHTRSA